MDFCRNVSVSGGLPSEYPPEQVLAPPSSKLSGSLDDLFSGQNTEVDVSLEWLSIFVEDCLSSTGNCLPGPAATAPVPAPAPAPKNVDNSSSSSTIINPTKPLQKKTQQNPPPSLQKFVIPSKARSKRKRTPIIPKTKPLLFTTTSTWANQYFNQNPQNSDPPLLQQAYWLADSELIVPTKKDNNNNYSNNEQEEEKTEEIEEEEEMIVGTDSSGSLEGRNGNGGQQQPRRCTHCLAQRTPQWRAGPLGPKTLCNACGVRYKSGRLLPEYRPAKSPTFVSYLHSNSHKKVMEMRMAVLSSIPSDE